MPDTNYRPDIDGLRAFAVLVVIIFHLDLGYLNGGFVGVDIFFVISGFLITGLIQKEVINRGSFDFTRFYIRRIRRLFPALFVTILVSSIISIFLLSPPHLERLGGSIIHALSSLSNFYFWSEADYFDSSADAKPLLHIWSLSVEEQFYLLWPFLFVFLIKKKSQFTVVLTLSAMAVISLLLNYFFQDGYVYFINDFSEYAATLIADGKSTIFYLLPFRLYEFALGSALVFTTGCSVRSRLGNEAIMLIGIILVAYSCVSFSEETIFPGYMALIPCVGAACIIFSGNKPTSVGKIFNNNVAVGLGLISYSLYLVHWPIIVFWKYFTFEAISVFEATVITLVSLSLACLMYKYVEQPYRVKQATSISNNFSATSAVMALFVCSLLVVMAANIWVSKGWYWRTVDRSTLIADLSPPEVVETNIQALIKNKWTEAFIFGSVDTNTKKVLVLGDSHAGHLKGLSQYLSKKYNLSFTFFIFQGCPPVFGTYKVYGAPKGIKQESLKQRTCREQTAIWEEHLKANEYDYVFLSSRWNWLFEPREYFDTKQRRDLLIDKSNRKFSVADSKAVFSLYLDRTVKAIQLTGARAVLFGQAPHSGKDLEGCDNVPTILVSEDDIDKRCNHVPRSFILQRSKFSDQEIQRIASINGATAVIPTKYFCKESSEFCQLIYNGVRLKDDDDHLNEFGSVYLAKEWEVSEDFPFKP
jgi:peptidoglycan/LPS O-acetylase OafA/YrhL